MSIQILQSQNVKPIGHTFNGMPIHTVAPSQYEERKFSCTPPLLTLSQGSNTSIVLSWASDDVHTIEDIVLQWLASNSSATEEPTFFNTFQTLREFKCLINGVQKCYLQDQQQIQAKVCDYLKKQKNVFHELQKCRQESGTTLAGDTIGTASSKQFQLPLSWLVPELKGMIPNISGIYKVQFDIGFVQNQSTAQLNSYFCKSNTTNNAYGSNLTYSSIEVKQLIVRHRDSRMYKQPAQLAMVGDYFDTVLKPGISWNTANTDKQTFNLANDFTKRNNICGLMVWLYDVNAGSSYDTATAGEMRSGPAIVGFDIKSRSNKIVDLAHATNDLQARKRYALDVNRRLTGVELPLEVLNESSDLAKFYMFGTYIDLSNIQNDDDAEGFSGVNNLQNDIEITLYCASSISANCNMYVMLHYKDIAYIDKNKNLKFLSQ